MDRGLLFWGLALVTAGAVALAGTQGLIDRSLLEDAWRLWPIVLIVVGLSIILSRTPFAIVGTIAAALVVGSAAGAVATVGPRFSCDTSETYTLMPYSGTFVGNPVSVDLNIDCGALDLSTETGRAWEAAVRWEGTDDQPSVVSGPDSLAIDSAGGDFTFFDGGQERWDVTLGSDLTYDLAVGANAAETALDLAGADLASLSIDPNAGTVIVDLAGATVEELDLSLNAGTASLSVDEASSIAGNLSTNAGSIELCTNARAAVRIVLDPNIAFSHNLDDSNLVQSGETFTSEGFEDADRRIDLRLEGNAGNFTLNPEEGCA